LSWNPFSQEGSRGKGFKKFITGVVLNLSGAIEFFIPLEIMLPSNFYRGSPYRCKKRSRREVRVLENLYSGTFSRLATLFPSILQESPQVTSRVAYKTYKNSH
jgi:hypothetical protein